MNPDTATINGHCTCACGCQQAPQYAYGLCADCWLRYLRGDEGHKRAITRWQLIEQEIPERHTGPTVRPAIGLAEALREQK